MVKKAVEQTGLIPRSIIRTFDRFKKQLFPEAEKLIIQEFRISRYQFLVSIKCLANLIFVPLLVNFFLKNFLLIPITENFWNSQQSDIFLNSYQQDQAFNELKKFQEKLYFDYLLTNFDTIPLIKNEVFFKGEAVALAPSEAWKNLPDFFCFFGPEKIFFGSEKPHLKWNSSDILSNGHLRIHDDIIKKLMKEKILELAIYHNHKSVLAITNLIGDFITFLVISLLIRYMKPEISILKSFLTESIYSLNDTKKSFLLILGTDLLVGFHSPRGWEICLELILRYFGFPENKDFVFLFVASFPVLLDTIFKYWIFRYLNKISPSTVATYHSMIE